MEMLEVHSLLAFNKHVFNCVSEFCIARPTAQQKQKLSLFADYMIMQSVANAKGLSELSKSICHAIIQI